LLAENNEITQEGDRMERISLYIWNDNRKGLQKYCKEKKLKVGNVLNQALMSFLEEAGYL